MHTRIRLTLTGDISTLWVDRRDDHGWQLLGDAQEATVPAWLARQLIDAGHAVDLDEPAPHDGPGAPVTIATAPHCGVWSPSERAVLTRDQTVSLPAGERERLAQYVPATSAAFAS